MSDLLFVARTFPGSATNQTTRFHTSTSSTTASILNYGVAGFNRVSSTITHAKTTITAHLPLPGAFPVLHAALPGTAATVRAIDYQFLDRCPVVDVQPINAAIVQHHFFDRCPAIDIPRVVSPMVKHHFLDKCPAIHPRDTVGSTVTQQFLNKWSAVDLTNAYGFIPIIALTTLALITVVCLGRRRHLRSSSSTKLQHSLELAAHDPSGELVQTIEEPTKANKEPASIGPVACIPERKLFSFGASTSVQDHDAGTAMQQLAPQDLALPESESRTSSRKKTLAQRRFRNNKYVPTSDLIDDFRSTIGADGLAAMAAHLPPPETVVPPSAAPRPFDEVEGREVGSCDFGRNGIFKDFRSETDKFVHQFIADENRREERKRGRMPIEELMKPVDRRRLFATVVEVADGDD